LLGSISIAFEKPLTASSFFSGLNNNFRARCMHQHTFHPFQSPR
jgi:hypothetical protein